MHNVQVVNIVSGTQFYKVSCRASLINAKSIDPH